MPAQTLASFHSDSVVNVHSVTKFRPFIVYKQTSFFFSRGCQEGIGGLGGGGHSKKENRNRLSKFCGGTYVCADMHEPPPPPSASFQT